MIGVEMMDEQMIREQIEDGWIDGQRDGYRQMEQLCLKLSSRGPLSSLST